MVIIDLNSPRIGNRTTYKNCGIRIPGLGVDRRIKSNLGGLMNAKENGGLMINRWIEEVKKRANPEELGMILIHNGIVRGTSKAGKSVHGMRLSYDPDKLNSIIMALKQKRGIVEIKAWINSGNLEVGDNIMLLLVAGRFKTDVSPVFDELLTTVKSKIVSEEEVT